MSRVKLGDIASIQSGPFGTQLHKNEYKHFGILMLNAKNIGNGTVITDSVDFVSQETADRLSKYKLSCGDIVFGRAGSIDKHVLIGPEYANTFQGTNCIRIRCENVALATYIAYYLWLPHIKSYIENSSGGSIQSYITSDFLKELEVNIPDNKADIEMISSLLSKIDRKIAINEKINVNLQQMAHIIYMHMFWGKRLNGKLGDIIIEQPKSTIQVNDTKNISGNIPFFTSGDAILKWNRSLVSGRNCFLNTGGNADVKFYVGESSYSTDTWCISAQNNMADYLYLLLDSIKPELDIKFFQGTSLRHLQKPLLKDRPIYIPSDLEIKKFNMLVQGWLSLNSNNIRESQKLERVRDWLLPMLMNGQACIES